MRSFLLHLLLLCSLTAGAQNLSADLQGILNGLDDIEAAGDEFFPALDRTIVTLAYYAGMPDRELVRGLTNGAALLDHFADNPSMRDFLLVTGLDVLIMDYTVDDPDALLEDLFAQRRSGYLRGRSPDDLFGNDGTLDLEAVLLSVARPDPLTRDLAAAADAAAARNLPTNPADVVSVALAGLSDWIARRAQAELTYTFLNRLREDLGKNELDHLFPNTAAYLPGLDLLNYRSILPSIRTAFLKDLNAVAYNLGRYLEERDLQSFRRPGVYNIFLLYRVLDLQIRDVPLPEIITFTYNELRRNREAARDDLDRALVVGMTESGAPFQSLAAALRDYSVAVQQLNTAFDAELNSTLEAFELTLDALDAAPESASMAGAGREVDVLFGPVSSLQLPRQSSVRNLGQTTTNSQIITKWLNGEEAYEFYEAYPTLTRYDELFGPEALPTDGTHRQLAGLKALRTLTGSTTTLATYAQQANLLERTAGQLEALRLGARSTAPPGLPGEVTYGEYQRNLQDRIEAAGRREMTPALRLLRSLTIDLPDDNAAAYEQLVGVERRLEAWLAGQADPQAEATPGVRLLPGGETTLAVNPSGLRSRLANVNAAHQHLRRVLDEFDRGQESDLHAALANLEVFESVFGLGQQLFFLLADSGDRFFVDKGDMSVFQVDPRAKQLLQGVTHERINRLLAGGVVHTPAATDFLLDFSVYLSEYQAKRTMAAGNPAESRIATVQFITQALELLFSAPVIRGNGYAAGLAGEAGEEQSLAERFPEFARIPAVNRELSEIFVYSQRGDFRYAIDNLLNLLELLDVVPGDTRGQRRFKEYLFRYGTFMADVVAAESPAGVEAALNAVALPTGSSQIKRTRRSSLELGAYFGAALGREELLPAGAGERIGDVSTTLSLFVPVGLSYSRSLGGRRSATLFASLLDLGGLTAFRLSDNTLDDGTTVERLPDLSLRNVIAPGVHFLYNFPKSPFSLGIGVQDGPAVRDYTPAGAVESREGRAVRFMVTGSVDVPIFRLGGE